MPPSLRPFLILGRVSNLPTVWSNCLAGWALGGFGDWPEFLLLCVGTSLLYLGGMYLNDAFDVHFDRQYRQERPIPSGAVQLKTVWLLGCAWLLLGLLLLSSLGISTGALSLLLIAFILLYDAVHKAFPFSPVLMASCRLLLYLVAASAGQNQITGLALWSATALALYIVGLSYLARRESSHGALSYWPCLLLAAPVVLALTANIMPYLIGAVILCVIFLLWTWLSIHSLLTSPTPNIGQAVSRLLAGIVLVDWLAVNPQTWPLHAAFAILFLLSLFFQRSIPAT